MAAIRKILAGGVHVSESVKSLLVERVTSGKDTTGRPGVDTLSDRELDVLRLIGSGFGTRRIAEHLQRSVKTIESHRANIKNKLGLKSAIERVQHAALWVRQQSAG